jgi:hypothetical protein
MLKQVARNIDVSHGLAEKRIVWIVGQGAHVMSISRLAVERQAVDGRFCAGSGSRPVSLPGVVACTMRLLRREHGRARGPTLRQIQAIYRYRT